jgi:hypothetical protein
LQSHPRTVLVTGPESRLPCFLIPAEYHGRSAYDDFYSKLKNCNTLESSRLHFDQLLTEGLTQEEVLKNMELKSVPPTGRSED